MSIGSESRGYEVVATVLDWPREGRRGLVCLTHKEASFLFSGSLQWGPLSRYRRFHPRGAVARYVWRTLKAQYDFGVHFGSRVRANHPANSSQWAFRMATPLLSDEPERRVVLTSAYFIPDDFMPSPGSEFVAQRRWDLVHIATASGYKNWDRALSSVASLAQSRPKFKALLVSTHGTEKQLRTFTRWLDQLLPNSVKDRVQHAAILTASGEKGLPEEVVKALLQSSKTLVLFSESEGTSKIVSEALMSGCRVVVYNTLLLNSAHHPSLPGSLFQMRIGSEEETIERCLDLAPESETDQANRLSAVRSAYSEERNIVRLGEELSSILGRPISLVGNGFFRLQLPAHTARGMPWIKDSTFRTSSDLSSTSDWFRFWRFLSKQIKW